jgi:hypothetical protein
VGGGLTARFWVMRELTPVALDCSSESCPIGKSSPKGCSRSARPPRTSQAAVRMKREQNCRLKEKTREKNKNRKVLINFSRRD